MLSKEEIDFLNKIENRKKKHLEAQKKYREKNKNKIFEYNKKYYYENKQKYENLKHIDDINTDAYINTNNDMIKQNLDNTSDNNKIIIPSYLRKDYNIKPTTILLYFKKSIILYKKLFNKNSIDDDLKNNLFYLFSNLPFDEKIILDKFNIFNDIDNTINILLNIYKNKSSFNSYLNILCIISSRLKTINNDIYQKITKLNMNISKDILEKRGHNLLNDIDKKKIIDINDKKTIYDNINKLKNIKDKLIYSLYLLFPSRRLEYRVLKYNNLNNIDVLNDFNYIYHNKTLNKIYFIFNDYKTKKYFKKQVFEITDTILISIIKTFINAKNVLNNSFIFNISQTYFSKTINKIFSSIYNENITLRYIRISWSIYINNMKICINDKKKLAEMMGHTYQQNLYYNKINV
jgi:hypothetical protein